MDASHIPKNQYNGQGSEIYIYGNISAIQPLTPHLNRGGTPPSRKQKRMLKKMRPKPVDSPVRLILRDTSRGFSPPLYSVNGGTWRVALAAALCALALIAARLGELGAWLFLCAVDLVKGWGAPPWESVGREGQEEWIDPTHILKDAERTRAREGLPAGARKLPRVTPESLARWRERD